MAGGQSVRDRARRHPTDGPGPNPLLQNHVLVAFHPPLLYLGLVGFTVPFAFAVRQPDHRTGRRGLAARDPPLDPVRLGVPHRRHHSRRLVELPGARAGVATGRGTRWRTPSFLPWITATAYLHSVMVQERRGMLRVWNLSLLMRHVQPDHPGHVPHPVGGARVGPRLQQVRDRAGLARLLRLVVAVAGRPARLAGRPAAFARAPSTRRCPARAPSWPTTCCSAPSPSSCCSARCSRSSPRRVNGEQITVGAPYFDRMTMPIVRVPAVPDGGGARCCRGARRRASCCATGSSGRHGSRPAPWCSASPSASLPPEDVAKAAKYKRLFRWKQATAENQQAACRTSASATTRTNGLPRTSSWITWITTPQPTP